MTRATAFFFTTFLCLTTGACDSEGDTGTDGGSSGTGTTTTDGDTGGTTEPGTTSAVTTAATGSATTAGTQSTGTGTATSTSGTQSSGAASDSSGVGSDSGSEESTSGATEAEICEATGGTWDDTACGHYVCGDANRCEALIPGCDCGDAMNYREGEGCQDDPACEAEPVTFACGDELACSVDAEYCEVFFPGVMMASINYTCQDMPIACQDDATCDCLEGELGLGFAATCTEDILTGGETVQIFAP